MWTKQPRFWVGELSVIWQLCAEMRGDGRSRIRMGMEG